MIGGCLLILIRDPLAARPLERKSSYICKIITRRENWMFLLHIKIAYDLRVCQEID